MYESKEEEENNRSTSWASKPILSTSAFDCCIAVAILLAVIRPLRCCS